MTDMNAAKAPVDEQKPPEPTERSPLRLGTLLAICRVSNLPTVWMNVLTAAALCGVPPGPGASPGLSPGVVLLLAASLSAFYCGGMALNDVFDRDWDAEHQPFRPIPAGRITLAAARRLTALLFTAALALLALAPEASALAPGLALLAIIFAYDRFHKAFAGAVFVMAATRAMVFVVTAWAVGGEFFPLVAIAAAAQFLYTVLVSAVARHENTRGVPYSFPLIPRMIAGMSVLDGTLLAIFLHPAWLLAGLAAAFMTHFGQRYVRGD
ncbi:MAG: UbiA family prenyltransferase [Deltaproteobacteria bacterium]|nr:UbiA family prenyltransferase [Deltaproteobacteria bacterium]MBW2421825.1 UbiA family prenyltransferase [Deltaproteobacteria bacterium]